MDDYLLKMVIFHSYVNVYQRIRGDHRLESVDASKQRQIEALHAHTGLGNHHAPWPGWRTQTKMGNMWKKNCCIMLDHISV